MLNVWNVGVAVSFKIIMLIGKTKDGFHRETDRGKDARYTEKYLLNDYSLKIELSAYIYAYKLHR